MPSDPIDIRRQLRDRWPHTNLSYLDRYNRVKLTTVWMQQFCGWLADAKVGDEVLEVALRGELLRREHMRHVANLKRKARERDKSARRRREGRK